MKTRISKGAALLSLLAIASVALILILHAHSDSEASGSGGYTAMEAVTAPHKHGIADTPQANFLSIFVYDANGGVSSFMVGGSTGEFKSMSGGIAGAGAVDAQTDASFSDLLVFSFTSGDTLELSYSQAKNIFILDGKAYRPAADLTPIIASVEKRLT